MRKFLMFFAAMSLGTVAFAADSVDFDRGIDLESFKEEMSDRLPPPPPPSGPMSARYTTDCHTFRLGPTYSSITTEMVRLRSQEFINECHYVPNPPPPPIHPGNGGHMQPPHPGNNNHGGHMNPPAPHNTPGHNGPGAFPGHGPKPGHYKSLEADTKSVDSRQMVCNERPGRAFLHNVRLNVGQRNLYPWEREEITVCAEHHRTWLREARSPYVYNVSERTQAGGGVDSTKTFVLAPMSRQPSAPDEDGMMATSFSYAGGKFSLNIADKWAMDYKGEKVIIHVELYRDRFLIDKSLGEKDFEFDVNTSYSLKFAESEFDGDRSAAVEPEEATRGKTNYYVKWGFRRIGYVSTDVYVKKGSTYKVSID